MRFCSLYVLFFFFFDGLYVLSIQTSELYRILFSSCQNFMWSWTWKSLTESWRRSCCLLFWHDIHLILTFIIWIMNTLQVHSGHHASGKSSKGQTKLRNGGYVSKKQSSYLSITSESLWNDIQEFAKLKYQVSWVWIYFIPPIWLGRIACLLFLNYLLCSLSYQKMQGIGWRKFQLYEICAKR